MPHHPAWPAEQDEHLKVIVADPKDYSFSEIAALMSAKFGKRFTRNSVLGRSSRLGLRGANAGIHKHQYRLKHAADPDKVRKKGVKKSKPSLPALPASSGDIDADSFLRAEGSRGASNLERMQRARTPEELAMRREGRLPELAAPEQSKAFLDTDHNACKWPADDLCERVCGEPATVGAYCTKHARLAYRTPPTFKRNRIVRAGSPERSFAFVGGQQLAVTDEIAELTITKVIEKL